MGRLKERRMTLDRRKFSYTAYSPERRTGKDRRSASAKTYKQKVA